MAANGKIAARQVKSRTFARKVGKVLYIIRRVYQTEYNIWKASKKKNRRWFAKNSRVAARLIKGYNKQTTGGES